jgi:hypothetical protein
LQAPFKPYLVVQVFGYRFADSMTKHHAKDVYFDARVEVPGPGWRDAPVELHDARNRAFRRA